MPRIKVASKERLRAQLGEVAADLEALQFRLLGVHASLPSAREPDPFSSLRAGIECALADQVAPAIEALWGLMAEMEAPLPEGDVH